MSSTLREKSYFIGWQAGPCCEGSSVKLVDSHTCSGSTSSGARVASSSRFLHPLWIIQLHEIDKLNGITTVQINIIILPSYLYFDFLITNLEYKIQLKMSLMHLSVQYFRDSYKIATNLVNFLATFDM